MAYKPPLLCIMNRFCWGVGRGLQCILTEAGSPTDNGSPSLRKLTNVHRTLSVRGRRMSTNFLLHRPFEHPQEFQRDIPAKFPGHPTFPPSKPKENKHSREGTNFLTPTPSRGRPPPHPAVSGPKTLISVLLLKICRDTCFEIVPLARRVTICILMSKTGNQPMTLQTSLGPSGPEMPKKSRKCLSGPPAPGPQQVSKKSRNTPKTLSRHFPETLRRLAGLSPRPGGPGGHAQRALRDILMSRGKNCLPTVSRQFLTRNYPRPNRLLKCLPNYLSPTGKGIFSSFKITPAVRVIARQLRDKNCLGATFAPGHQDVSQGPLGVRDFFGSSGHFGPGRL